VAAGTTDGAKTDRFGLSTDRLIGHVFD